MNMRDPKMDIGPHATQIIACSNRGDKNRILRYKTDEFSALRIKVYII